MITKSLQTAFVLLASIALIVSETAAQNSNPNIVYILCDDLGYGDVKVLNPDRCLIETPQMDQLAKQGMIFTDAHTSSSVCTPTRYGILTGRYNWRTRLQNGVLYGFHSHLIDPNRFTVADLMKEKGYTTACIGKWHLGMDFSSESGKPLEGKVPTDVDWNKAIKNSPVAYGFDYFYGISASLDMPPYIFIENDRFDGEATDWKTFYQERFGPAHPELEAVDVLPTIELKTVEFIKSQKKGSPFFAYVALTSPHTPIVPSVEWQGKSEVGSYGDFVMHTDHVIGSIVKALDESGFGENTIVIVTSDNGCSKAANIEGLQEQGHFPSAHMRGSKADLWDGGHRVPFIVRWPAEIDAGTQCDDTICLTDLMATCADLVGSEVPDSAGEDSVSFLAGLSGKPIVSNRKGIIHHSISGHFSYRMGKWKLLLAKGSGGWTFPREKEMPVGSHPAQLYDLDLDPWERTNLYTSHPEVVKELLAQLELDVNRGRSTVGPDSQNDVDSIRLWKSGRE